jgi:ABC-type glycerol-3-phosphate transport system substrate-binding protein
MARIVAAGIAVMLFVSSCNSKDSIFPTIPDLSDPSSSSVDESTIQTNPENSTATELRLAAPVSEQTAEYLLRLYFAKKNGLLGEGMSGADVPLDFLDTIETDFDVDVYTTASTGANMTSISTWKNDKAIPDIICTDSLSELVASNDIIALNSILADNPLLLSSNLYLNYLNNLVIEDFQYGIPYSASVEVIFVNNEVLDAAEIPRMPFETDLIMLTEISRKISELNSLDSDPTEQVIPFYQASDLLFLLPASFSGESAFSMNDEWEIDLHTDAFLMSVEYLRSYASDGYCMDLMTDEELESIFGTFDPILSKRVAMWVGNSEEISRWSNFMPYTLSIIQIPSISAGELSPPALTVYPLCISATCEYPDIAADFATFIALDEDAILLTIRLENSDGFIPVVKSSLVWENSKEKSVYGAPLFALKDIINEAYILPSISNNILSENIENFLLEFSYEYLDTIISLDELPDKIDVQPK